MPVPKTGALPLGDTPGSGVSSRFYRCRGNSLVVRMTSFKLVDGGSIPSFPAL
jgi:hypothetical protein